MWWFGSFKFSEKDIKGLGQRALVAIAIVHIVLITFMLLVIWGLIAWMGVGLFQFLFWVFVGFGILSWLAGGN